MKHLATLLLLSICALNAQADSTTVSGTVLFEGKPPTPPVIDTRGDKYCVELHKDNPLHADGAAIGANGEFQWIFVWIDNPPEGDYLPPEEPALLTQKNCRYEQPVLALMAGQPLEMHNNDDTTHNVRGFPKNNKIFNFGQPPGLPSRHRTFPNAEKPLKIKCDVHRWMLSYAFVMDHPFFAVTDEKGQFTIQGLPAGNYTLKTWHDKLGELQQEITVGKDALGGLSFTYKRPARK